MHPLGPASGAPIDWLGVQKKKKYIYIYIYTYIYAVAARSTTDAHGHQLFCYICTLVARRTCDYRAFLLFQFSDQGVARAVLYLLFRWSVVRRPTSLYQRKIGEGNFGWLMLREKSPHCAIIFFLSLFFLFSLYKNRRWWAIFFCQTLCHDIINLARGRFSFYNIICIVWDFFIDDIHLILIRLKSVESTC